MPTNPPPPNEPQWTIVYGRLRLCHRATAAVTAMARAAKKAAAAAKGAKAAARASIQVKCSIGSAYTTQPATAFAQVANLQKYHLHYLFHTRDTLHILFYTYGRNRSYK